MDWDTQYRNGQGRYFPNEELIRFLGRTYGSVIHKRATGLTAIEIGCGVGGNIWALTQWGFFGYGLEMSTEAIRLAVEHARRNGYEHCKEFRQYKAPETIRLPARSAQLVIDIQTVQHLTEDEHQAMYQEIYRLLAPGGRFFSMHWSNGDASQAIFPDHPELAQWTGKSLFLISEWMKHAGLSPISGYFTGRTYNKVTAQWAVIEAVKS